MVGVDAGADRGRGREIKARSVSELLDPLSNRRTDHRRLVRARLVPAIPIGWPVWLVVVSLVFIAALIALASIDFETTYLPDTLVLPLLIVAIVVSFTVPDREWWQGLAGAAAGYAVFYPFAWIGDRLNRPIMGWGDVKLAAALGAILGLAPLGLGLYIGVIIGGAVAIVVYAARMFGINRILIPYGPYLVAGGIISMLYFRSIADWISGQL